MAALASGMKIKAPPNPEKPRASEAMKDAATSRSRAPAEWRAISSSIMRWCSGGSVLLRAGRGSAFEIGRRPGDGAAFRHEGVHPDRRRADRNEAMRHAGGDGDRVVSLDDALL